MVLITVQLFFNSQFDTIQNKYKFKYSSLLDIS